MYTFCKNIFCYITIFRIKCSSEINYEGGTFARDDTILEHGKLKCMTEKLVSAFINKLRI